VAGDFFLVGGRRSVQRALPIFLMAADLAQRFSVPGNQNSWASALFSTALRSFTDFQPLEFALPFLVFA